MLKTEIQAGCQVREFYSSFFTRMKVSQCYAGKPWASEVNSISLALKEAPSVSAFTHYKTLTLSQLYIKEDELAIS